MANPLVRVVYIAHGLLNARTSLFVVVCAMLFIGIQKARGKMPHPASRAIGRGEFIGAMFMVMPDSYMQGFGQIAGAGVILAVMGAMVAIKPKAFVTEAFFIANASKVLAANWGAQDAHKPLTDALTWETAMTFAVAQGASSWACASSSLAGTPRGGPSEPTEVRNAPNARERVGVSARRGAPSRSLARVASISGYAHHHETKRRRRRRYGLCVAI